MERHFGRSCYLARNALSQADPLFSWEDLNSILNSTRHMAPRLRLERDRRSVPNDYLIVRTNRRGSPVTELRTGNLLDHLRDGATLILDAVDESHPRLGELCHSIANEFAADVQINLYAAWRDVQGFDTHWDGHDVFVLQISGRKKWHLFEMGHPRPLHVDHHYDLEPPLEPAETIVLEPGDVLYIPRGYWHSAVGLGEPAMHLTLGVSQRSGAEFLTWLSREALHLTNLRETFPMHASHREREEFVRRILEAVATADVTKLVDDFERFARDLTRERPRLGLPEIGLGGAEGARAASQYVMIRKSARIVEEDSSDTLFKLRHGRHDITLHAALRPIIERMIDGEAVTKSALEAAAAKAATAHETAQLIDELVALHVLVPVA